MNVYWKEIKQSDHLKTLSYTAVKEFAEMLLKNLMPLFSSVPQSANTHKQDKGIVSVACSQ